MDLVLAVPMGTDQFVLILSEHQVAHLAISLHRVHQLVRDRVPESDGPVCRAPSRNQQAMLVRRPSQCLDSSLVFEESSDGSGLMGIPDEQFVVIAPTSQLLVIEGPLESTDLLRVFLQSPDRLVTPDVQQRNSLVPTASSQNTATIEGQTRDSLTMQRVVVVQHLLLLAVPDLDPSIVQAY